MHNTLGLLVLFTSLMLPRVGTAQPLEAHVHGKALLQVAVDQQTLTLYFSSPLDNLLGFEHKPRTKAQIDQVNKMIKQFYQDQLFSPSKAAQCTLKHVDLDSLVIKKKYAEHHEDAHKHETHEHETHQHASGKDHADLDAEVIYHCKQAKRLTDLKVNVFKAFPNLHALDVEIVSNRGQSAQQLTPKNNRVIW